jgi:hypothetical protein
MAREPARNDHDAHRAIAPPLDPVRGNVGGAAVGGAGGGSVLDGGEVAGGAVVGGGVVVDVGGSGALVVVEVEEVEEEEEEEGGSVVVVGGAVVVVVVGGGAMVRSTLMVTGVGTARRWDPGAENVRAGPGPIAVARTSPLTGPPIRTSAIPSALVVASKRSAASSKLTSTPAIGPPGPVSRTVTSAPPSERTEISGPVSVHGPRRAVASAASSTTAASTSGSRPDPRAATSTAGPCHTGPPELRWASA